MRDGVTYHPLPGTVAPVCFNLKPAVCCCWSAEKQHTYDDHNASNSCYNHCLKVQGASMCVRIISTKSEKPKLRPFLQWIGHLTSPFSSLSVRGLMTLYFPVLHVPYGFWFRARPIPPAMFIIVTTQVHAHLHPRKLTWNPKIDNWSEAKNCIQASSSSVSLGEFPKLSFGAPVEFLSPETDGHEVIHHWRTNLKITICVCFFKLRVAPNKFIFGKSRESDEKTPCQRNGTVRYKKIHPQYLFAILHNITCYLSSHPTIFKQFMTYCS